jgi:hypothetical protein
LQEAVVAVLLTLLGNDGSDDWHERRFIAAIGEENALRDWKNAQDNVGESLGQGDGIVEIVDWE